MQIKKRYKAIGRKKYVILPLSETEVNEKILLAMDQLDETDSLVGTKDANGEFFKFNYRPAPGKKNVYEDYCLLASITSEEDGNTRIEYRFALDRWMSIYTKALAGLCFIIPVIIALLAGLVLQNTNPLIYIPLALIAMFALGSFLFFFEKKEKVFPIVDAFEAWIVSIFDKGE